MVGLHRWCSTAQCTSSIAKNGRSANYSRKSQIRKFAGLNFFRLRISDLRTIYFLCFVNPIIFCRRKTSAISNFGFAEWHTSEIADLRLRNKPNNLRICDLRTYKKILRAHLWALDEYSTWWVHCCLGWQLVGELTAPWFSYPSPYLGK